MVDESLVNRPLLSNYWQVVDVQNRFIQNLRMVNSSTADAVLTPMRLASEEIDSNITLSLQMWGALMHYVPLCTKNIKWKSWCGEHNNKIRYKMGLFVFSINIMRMLNVRRTMCRVYFDIH